MATILCLETATTNCSIALSVNGSVIVLQEDNDKQYSHAERLHVYIDEVLQKANINKNDLDAIAVSKGPGSYTGLRIGASAAKGLCYALDIPLISVPTLNVLAEQVEDEAIIIPLLDARRMEVYSAVFSSEKKQLRETRAEILSTESFSSFLAQGKTIFIGNGVAKFQAICAHENAEFRTNITPSSNNMAQIAFKKYQNDAFEDVAYFEPYYLKDFIAG